ncbi:MAG TPA: hypothetical protein VEQ60_23840 [Longimicrobium sp.]|nr:hypothetical protein [Longimicrobium sp.]
MEYFIDRDLGKYDFPEYLRAHGITAHAHGAYFPQDAQDQDWIPEVAARGWVIVAADKMVLHRPLELAAVMQSSARFINLTGGHAKALDLAINFVNTIEKIERFIETHTPPFVAKVTRPSPVDKVQHGVPGTITLKMDYAGWLRSPRSERFRP